MNTPPDLELDPKALALLRRVGGNALLAQLAAAFLGQAATRLEAARAGVAAGDAAPVALAMHTLKSSSRQLGAMALGDLCAETEALAARGDLAPLPGIVDQVGEELERVRHSLGRETARKTDEPETT